MSTDHHSEQEITLVGPTGVKEVHTMKMTAKAILEIEQKTNKSMLAMVRGLGHGDLSFTDAAIVLQAGVRAGAPEGSRTFSLEGAIDRIMKSGSAEVLKRLGEFVVTVMTLPEDAEAAKAQAKKVESEA